MPGMDKTGPLGTGPIGRGLGPCRGGSAGWVQRGFGFGRGFGRGWGFWPGNFTPEDEKTQLENEKKFLESQLEALKKRLQELEWPEQRA